MSGTDLTTWRCPACAREFARKSQAHSCKVVSVESHLANASPATLKVYAAVRRVLQQCGPHRVAPTKSQITFLARTSFAGMTIRRDWINLGFLLTRDLDDPRVFATEQLSPKSFAHKVQLRSTADIDQQLKRWLKEAYEVGLAAGRRTKKGNK